MELTELQRRVLTAATWGGGRIIYWIVADGRAVLPGFPEDVAGAIQALEGAGLFTTTGPGTRSGRSLQTRGKGSHVLVLSESGKRALAQG